MKISDLIKKLIEIKDSEGNLFVTNSNYDINSEPWIYVSKPEDDDDTLGTFLVIEG